MFKIFNKDLKGFTLIELLVVIAIIGILATVVIGAVNSARSKGADAGIRGNIANMRPSAEILYDSASSYVNVCATTQATYAGVLAASKINGGSAATVAASTTGTAVTAVTGTGNANGACQSNAAGWAALAILKSDQTRAWCADSTGANKEVTSLTIAAGGVNAPVCP